MAENDKRKPSFSELSALRYDLAYDVYRQRINTEMLVAGSKGELLPYYAYKWFPNQIAGLALVLNPYWMFDQKLRTESNKLSLKWFGYSVYPPSSIAANRKRSRQAIWPTINTTKYTVFGTIEGTHLYFTGTGWEYPLNPVEYSPLNGTWTYHLFDQVGYCENSWDTTWKSRNPGLKQIPKKPWKKDFGLTKPVRPTLPSVWKDEHPGYTPEMLADFNETWNKYRAAYSKFRSDRKAAAKAASKQKKLRGIMKRADAADLVCRGEAEFVNVSFKSTTPSVSWTDTDYSWNDFWSPSLWTRINVKHTVTVQGGSAIIAPDTIDLSLAKERLDALDDMASMCDSLVARCLPNRRRYNGFYQLGELRDLPQTLRGTLAAWRDLEKLLGVDFAKSFTNKSFWSKDKIVSMRSDLARCNVILDADKSIGSAYLTYLFGWQSMVSALEQLLKAPERVSKEVNFLFQNNGKLVRMSTVAHLRDTDWPSHPAITPLYIQPMLPDPNAPLDTTHSRTNRSIRCVVESGIMLPTIDPPRLRQQLVVDKFGLWPPRPSDIYNLIPWTWLADWVADFSGYLSLVEEIQLDKQLINWGMLTYKSKLACSATCGSFMDYTDYTHNASLTVNSLTKKKAVIESRGDFEATYFLRRSVESLQKVNTKLANGFNLSSSQSLILAALVATRAPSK